jgi:hypothetical protein
MQRKWKIGSALMAIMVVGATFAARFQTTRAQGAQLQLQSATMARATLDKLDRAKMETIRDAKVRADLLAGYDALKAVAENTSQTREHVLLARVHTVALKLKHNSPDPAAEKSVDGCAKAPCKLGTQLCQLTFDMCIEMVRWEHYFPPGAPG